MVKIVLITISVLVAGIYFSLFERIYLGILQQRVSPNTAGGLTSTLQPIADAFKFLSKKDLNLNNGMLFTLKFSSFFFFVLALYLIIFSVFSGCDGYIIYNSNEFTALLFLILIVANLFNMGYISITSGSRFSFMSFMRMITMFLSHSINITLFLINLVLVSGSCNIKVIVEANQVFKIGIMIFPVAIIMYILIISETGRVPFDVSEAEAELASSYLLEIKGMSLAIIMLSEYVLLYILLFAWTNFFFGSCVICTIVVQTAAIFLFLTLRAILPNIRWDYITAFQWKIIFPLLLSLTICISCLHIHYS